jgi:glycosyltransferase involved in cell wall biosynthesis
MNPDAPDSPLRVAVLSELPTPYRWPLFQRVAAEPGLDATVFFYSRNEADRDWTVSVDGSVGTSGRPRVEFLPGRALHVAGKRSLFFHWNPGIVKRLRKTEFDVVVIPGWSMPTSVAAALSCRRRGIPYVIFSETHARSPRPAWLRAAKRVALRPIVAGASAWLATGTLSEEFFVKHGAERARIFRFANTPDVDALRRRVDEQRPRRADVRAALGVPADEPLALFVARLIGAKDPATLLEAQAILEARGAAPWLVFVGDGPEAKTLRAFVETRRLSRVRFAGVREPSALPEIYASADLFVLPSLHEPWGVVVNEAMAAGLPVVLTDRVGAAADLLVDGVNGRLVPAGDAARMADAVGEIAGDAALRARMGAESLRIVAGWGYEPSVRGFVAAVRTAAGRRR